MAHLQVYKQSEWVQVDSVMHFEYDYLLSIVRGNIRDENVAYSDEPMWRIVVSFDGDKSWFVMVASKQQPATPVSTPKVDHKQYQVACWFVRHMHYVHGVVENENVLYYLDYYGGFQCTWTRLHNHLSPHIANMWDSIPEAISEHIFALALDAWQNNPNRS